MRTIEGHDVKIFTDDVEEVAVNQTEQLVEQPAFNDSKGTVTIENVIKSRFNFKAE